MPPTLGFRLSSSRLDGTIGVFGEEILLWICMLRQAQRRAAPDHVHRQANVLLDELGRSALARELPVESVDDGMFAIAALLDEIAMTLPDLRPLWSQAPLQSTRWMTNNAGVELFERLERVRSGPKPVLATFVVVLGVGFVGRYALPGADRDELLQLRRRLAIELGVDADRDWPTGVLKRAKLYDGGDASQAERWFEKLVTGRVLAASLLVASVSAVLFAIFGGGR